MKASKCNSINQRCGRSKRRNTFFRLAMVGLVTLSPCILRGAVLVNGMGGPEGFGVLALGRNDDSSSNRLDLPFSINFYGSTFSNFFVNNNGNLTFQSALSQYTPQPFPVSNQPMIAPWWADVDTRPANSGAVYVGSPNPNTVAVTWSNVGYYNSNTDRLNSFQALLRNRSDTGVGNFDIEFRYSRLEWTTGDVSGGIPAQAGFDAGNGRDFYTLPGSRTAAVLNLTNLSNVSSQDPGLWAFPVRIGQLPDGTIDRPYMPNVVIDNEWHFNFNVGSITDRIFIDPAVAIGYDYFVDSGPLFSSVVLPTGIGDGLFDLWGWNPLTLSWFDTGSDITGGVPFDFAAGGIDRFRILGVEESAGLDPTNTRAFRTGLTFASPGTVSMRQVALSNVPEPGTALAGWAICGILGLSRVRRLRAR